MSKVRILGAAFFAVLAFAAVSAASASAGEWLKNGALIGVKESAVTEGTWLLEALGFGGFSTIHIVCNGKLRGTVGPMAEDEVTAAEGLKAGETLWINCEVLKADLGVCSGSTLALVMAINLPWHTELLLPSSTEIVDHFGSATKKPGFEIECTTGFGTKFKESCEGNVLTKALSNVVGGGVLGEILNALSEKCSGGAGNVAHTYGHGVTNLLSGALSVS